MIRVLIERRFLEGMQQELERVVTDVIHAAVRAPGYLSGEILRDTKDRNHYVVVSSWRSVENWEAWLVSPERQLVMGHVNPMLIEPERILVMETV